MPSLDTNCLLRLFLGDIPEQAALIKNLINSEKTVAVADAAIIETVFVLEKVMKLSRLTIEKAITAVIEKDSVSCNRDIFTEILPVYASRPKLSFVDCYLEALSRSTGNTPLLTFDKKLANQLPGAQILSM